MKNLYNYLRDNILYYLVYLLFIIEIIINLHSKYMSNDESFTYNMIHHSFTSIINLTAQDVHPFLYYFISKIFINNVQNMYSQICILRIVSALPYFILLIISNIYIKNKFSKSVSIMFMFCIISMPLLIDNIYTLRMYGWATLFIMISYLLFRQAYEYEIYNNIFIFIFISFFSILSSYTHYYALLTIFIMYISFIILFIIKQIKLRYIILSIFIDILLYIPWLKILLDQTRNASKTFWSSKLTLWNIVHMIIRIFSPAYKLTILYILPLLLLITILITILLFILDGNFKIIKINIVGIMIPFLVILLGIIFSIFIKHSVILARYVAPSISIFWFELIILIMNIKNKYKILKNILIYIILIIAILSYSKNNKHIIHTTNQFNQTLKIYNKISKNSAIIYNDNGMMFGTSDYLHNNYTLDQNNNVYRKTINNVKQKNNIKLPLKYKNVYYFKSNNSDILVKKFNNKYMIYNKKKIYLPTNPQINIYKIK